MRLRNYILIITFVTSLFAIHGNISAEDEILDSQSNPLASLYGFPETNINGVNIINGDYNYSVVDFHLPGSDPLILQRSYSTSNTERRAFFEGWTHNLCSTIKVLDLKKNLHVQAVSYGSLSGEIPYTAKRFKSRTNQIHTFKIVDKILEKGITNSGRGEISGRTNLKNSSIDLRKSLPSYLSQTNSDGSRHTHKKDKYYEENEPVCYNLVKTQKPTGCTVKYDTSEFFLQKISQYDLQGNLTQMLTSNIADETTLKTKETNKRSFYFDIFSEDGRKVTYHFKPYKKHGDKENTRFTCLEKIKSTHTPDERYLYTEQKGKTQKKLKERCGDSHRVQINYFNKGDLAYKDENSNVRVSRSHIAFGRVKELKVAVNNLANLELLCRFTYTENKKTKEAFTDAYDDQNRLTRYIYSTKDYRLRKIDHFDGSDVYKITRTDKMIWGAPGSQDNSNLITRSIDDGRGKIHFAENYQYDQNGNPIRKEYHFLRATSLTESPITLDGDKVRGGNVKFFETEYNDSNLPTRIYDGRIHTELSYVPSSAEMIKNSSEQKFSTTPLVKRRLKKDRNRILKREFYDYDHTIGSTLYMSDDGSGVEVNDLTNVHQRLINRCINKNGVFAGLPLIVTSSGWDSNQQQEQLIKKTEYEYDEHGHINFERHYGSDDILAYTIHKTHDIQGNILYETDPLGQPTSRTFDKYCCVLKEQGPSQTYYTENKYDLLQRPVSTTQTYTDGLKLSTQTTYDLKGNPINETGIYGQTTIKHYNNQNCLKTLIDPPVRTHSLEWRSPQTEYTYDLNGNVATEIDLSGAQTKYQNSTLGKPLSVQYPDGRIEYFSYSIFGELVEKTAPNGTRTIYAHDSLGRVLSETVYDSQGKELKSHNFIYEGANLVKEVEGALTTTYSYDHAGRIIRKNVGNNCVEYTFDALGRQTEEKSYYGNDPDDYILTKKNYDLLNRVVEEQVIDSTGKIHRCSSQTYDELDNVTSSSVTTHAGIATTLKNYDLRGNLCSETDPLGNTTHYIHKYDHFFEGYNVPYMETIDPLGVKKITISDYQNRTLNEKIYSPMGELLSEIDMIYDVFGNLVRKEQRLPQEIITTLYDYDLCHRLIRQVNGAGTPEQITTTFRYNSFGELAETSYSDGTSKYHYYDALGRLQEERSSDNSIHYFYTYNQNDLPIKIENLITGAKTIREYSPEGNLLLEQFEHGLEIRFSYDLMNRIIESFLPDGSSIKKTYNPVSLAKTERIQNGVVIYDAQFKEFDLTGTPKQIRFPKSSGILFLEFDLLNRPISLTSTHYNEKQICYDTRGQLASKFVNNDLQKFEHDFLCQLTLEKSSNYLHTYQNDALNRQLIVDGVSQTHNAVQQLTQGIHGEYIFDPKGRRIRDSAIQYIYDSFDRLQQINRSDETWDYAYDAFNRKMSQSKNGEPSFYIYDGNEEIGSFDRIGNKIDLKILSVNEGSIPIAIELGQETYAPLISTQGHIVGLVSIDEGNLIDEHHLTMFGRDLNDDPLSPWRFCGKRHEDAILGIIDFGQRYYHAKSAQWMTRDPIGECDGPNLYAYVHNNPTRCIDRYGLFSMSWGFNSNDSDTSFKTVVKGICHGLADFACETVWDLQRAAFYIGCDQSEFDYNERDELTSHFNQMEIEQRLNLEVAVKDLLAVEGSDEDHDSIRYRTTTGLQIASLAYGGIKGVQGLYNLGKNLYNARKLASTLPKLSSTTSNSIWTSRKNGRTSVQNAYRHWKDHGGDFADIQNSKQYVEKARKFYLTPPKGTLIKTRLNGDYVHYHPDSNIFGIYTKSGLPKTLYKPDPIIHRSATNLEYFNAQR